MDEREAKKIAKRVIAVVGGLVVLVFLLSSYTVISPGNTGVVFNSITGGIYTTGQGIVFKVPFVTRVQSYPTALRTYTMVQRSTEGSSSNDDSLDLPTLEGQHIRQDLSVTYNTSEDKAAQVFKSFRGADIGDIENTFIRRTTITVAQNVAGQMSLSDVISIKRSALQSSIQEALGLELSKMGFTLDKVNLGASHLPEAIEKQMQEKMRAQQEAKQAEYELQKQEMLAKANIAKAKGQAEANRLVQSTLTPNLIQQKAIDKWDGALPQITSGSVPFINLKGIGKE